MRKWSIMASNVYSQGRQQHGCAEGVDSNVSQLAHPSVGINLTVPRLEAVGRGPDRVEIMPLTYFSSPLPFYN